MSRYLIATVVLLGLAGPARADQTVVLLDNTKLVGKVLHFYDGQLTLELPNKSKMRLPLSKVRRIDNKPPKPRKALSTPLKSFNRLRRAALRGDLSTYVDSHSSYYQLLLSHQLAVHTPRRFAKQLKKQWGDAQLKIVRSKVKGKLAVLTVKRSRGQRSEEGDLHFVKENREWKMILPL